MIRQKPGRVEPVYIGIPREIYEKQKNVNLTADKMFVNELAFLLTLSRNIWLFTAEHLPSCKAGQLSSVITTPINIYSRGGFIIRVIMVDMEFEKLKDAPVMELIDVNTTVSHEHVN